MILRWRPDLHRPGRVAVVERVVGDVIHFTRKGEGGYSAYDVMRVGEFLLRVDTTMIGYASWYRPKKSVYARAMEWLRRRAHGSQG